MTNSGIYRIRNTTNGKCYIGSTANLKRRWRNHLSVLRHRGPPNTHLQRAFDKYGEAAFIFEVLEEVEPEILIKREQHYLNMLKPEYNIASIAGSPLGVRHTDEARAKNSAARMGERNPNYGKHHSVETRAKIGAAQIGRQHSAETRAKMSKAGKGKHKSAETRAKMSEAARGKHPSAETCAKISAANTGKHPGVETRRKIGAAQIGRRSSMYGKHHNDETKQKMSVSLRAYQRRVHEAKIKEISEHLAMNNSSQEKFDD